MLYRNDDEVHIPRRFVDVSTGSRFRTGSSDLKIWKKQSECCAVPVNGGSDRKFSKQQTVYVLKGK